MPKELLSFPCALAALMFKSGKGLLIGVEGNEASLIPIPQSDILFILFIALAFIWLIPAWIPARIFRYLKLRKLKSPLALLKRRIAENEKEAD